VGAVCQYADKVLRTRLVEAGGTTTANRKTVLTDAFSPNLPPVPLSLKRASPKNSTFYLLCRNSLLFRFIKNMDEKYAGMVWRFFRAGRRIEQ